jgi:low affinity Fe/Cu permease
MTISCPKCRSQIGVVSIRPVFACRHCGQRLTSNFNEIIPLVGIVFFVLILVNSLVFGWLFGFTKLVMLAANLAVAIETVAFFIFLFRRKTQLNENA